MNRTTEKSLEGPETIVVATGINWLPSPFYDAAYKTPNGKVGLWRRMARGAGSNSTVDEAEASDAEGWESHSLRLSYPPLGDNPGYCATDWADMPKWLVSYAIKEILRQINNAARVFDGDVANLLLHQMQKGGYRFRNFYEYRREGGMAVWEVEGGEKSHVFVHKEAKQVAFADSSAEAIRKFNNDETVVPGFVVDWTRRVDHKKAVELPVVARPKGEDAGNIFILRSNGTVYLAKSYENIP